MANNDYDRVFRENIREIFVDYVEHNLDLRISESRSLPTKITGTYEREVDFLVEAISDKREKFLIHFEFQTHNDPTMLARVVRYHGVIYHMYRLPIHHFMIYLGKGASTMRNELKEEEIFRGFYPISLGTRKLQEFLDAERPEEILLGILSDFEEQKNEQVIHLVIEALQAASENDQALSKFLKQLSILSRIRKLDKEVIEQIKSKMPFDFDWKNFAPVVEAREEGRMEGQSDLILHLVIDGDISLERGAEKLGIDPEEMQKRINSHSSK